MATSRTGTAKWKRTRSEAIKQAQRDGLDHCPACRTHLDYERSGQPNSAEVDHIVPYSLGGTDDLANVRVLCRWCNQARGNGTSKRVRAVPTRVVPTTRVEW